jgi:hypothetical protein
MSPPPRCPSTRGFFFVLDARIRVEKALRAGAVQGGQGSGCPGDEVVMARATRNRRPSRAVDLNRAIIISPPISQIARLETPDVPLRGFFARIYHLLVALAHHHADIAAPAPAAHKPRRPIRHRHLSAISLGHFGRIGFCPVPTIGKTQGP